MKNNINSYILSILTMVLLWEILPSEALAGPIFPPPGRIKYPALELRIPQAERIVLDNGMILFFLQDRELPLVSISVMVRTGSMYDPTGKEGLADLTASVMRTGGTSKLSGAEIDKRLDVLAVSPSMTMSLDSASLKFSSLKSDLDACLDLFSQMLREPAFEEEKLSLAISLKHEELRRIADNPQRLAFREFNRLLYPDDPRGRYATPDSLRKICRDDLQTFHKSYFFPSNMLIAVSGDISREEAINKIRQYFGDWKNKRNAVEIAPPPKHAGQGVFLIRKQLPQSTVVSGEFTVSKNNPHYYAFTLIDFIIGSGGFPSRIFSAVRNNEGLAYSAGSFYRARPSYGVFGTYAFTKTESTIQAFHLLSSIVKNVSSGAITTTDLEWAKKSTINGFIFSFEQPADIVSQQMAIDFENLPADYLTGYRKRIEALTLSDLKRVAARYLHKEKKLMIIVGDTDRFGKFPDTWGKPVFISPKP